MIFGVGVDIVEIARLRRSFDRYGERLARRILTTDELVELARARRPERFLAMRFAAKEAVSKAFGTGFREGVAPRCIGVHHDPRGKPTLVFRGAVAERARECGISASHVSLADENEYAIAWVVLETAIASNVLPRHD